MEKTMGIEGYMIIPVDMWTDFSGVATAEGLPFVYSREEDGFHVYGPGLGELEDILWSIRVVAGLASVFRETEVLAFSHVG